MSLGSPSTPKAWRSSASRASVLWQGWSQRPPAQRLAAASLLAWMVAVPCGLALLLGPEPTPAVPAAPAPRARSATDGEAMAVILQRPLFRRSRRPPAPPLVQAPPPPAPQPMRDRNLAVRGIVIGGGAAKAFIAGGDAPQGTWVGIGDAIGGWQVVAIEPQDVQFKGGDEGFMAMMNATGGP